MSYYVHEVPGRLRVKTPSARGVNSKGILEILEEKGLFDSSQLMTGDQYLHNRMEKTGQVIGKAIFGLVLEKAFEGTPMALLSVLI